MTQQLCSVHQKPAAADELPYRQRALALMCCTARVAGKPPAALAPPAPGAPLLDLQSMSSADDPLDCFVGMRARSWDELARLPESEWRV